ncbi:MAG: glycosyltransferase family 2 protein [Bacteroidota bacterium]
MYSISVIIPIYNESKNIPILFEALDKVLANYEHEIIAVNDGSKDDSLEQLKKISSTDKRVKIINFKNNFGQTAAINAGIQNASKEILIFIDSDLENDPNDIPALLKKIEEGFDVVSGWRKERWKGQWLTRKLPSTLANKLISRISGINLHDYGCTLKAYRREVIKNVLLYGEMHRFIPVYASWNGSKVEEIPVNYRARIHGKSNYGIARTYKVLLDLVMIKFFQKYSNKPIHFFGGAGLISFLFSFLLFVIAVYFKVTGQKDFVETPLPVLCAMFFIIGILMILLGVIAEVQMRTYYESQNKTPYIVEQKINF